MKTEDTLTKDELGWFIFVAEHSNGCRIEMRSPGDSCISDIADTIETFLIAAGYMPEQVKELFK
jgi:hypothetical protein